MSWTTPALLLWGVAISTLLPGWAVAGNGVLRAGSTWQVPRTTGPDGYGNHGKYDGTNGDELDRADRRHANWDRAPGFFAELAWAPRPWRTLGGTGALRVEAFTRLIVVDTEFNNTQNNWWFYTQTAGLRLSIAPAPLPWLQVLGGVGIGAGHVARENTALREVEYGLALGPLRLLRTTQLLSGNRRVDHVLTSFTFDVGALGSAPGRRAASPWELRVLNRLAKHPERDVKTMQKTGVALAYLFGVHGVGCPLLVEAEVSQAAVEARQRRPLDEDTPHNFRTQDELFYALYLGRRECLRRSANLYVDLRLGVEAYAEDDERVNPGKETGWFTGLKGKIGLWRWDNPVVGYGANLVVGYDSFGINGGFELAVSSRL